jgi:hypothetical protein
MHFLNTETSASVAAVIKLPAPKSHQNRITLRHDKRSPGEWRHLRTRSAARLATPVLDLKPRGTRVEGAVLPWPWSIQFRDHTTAVSATFPFTLPAQSREMFCLIDWKSPYTSSASELGFVVFTRIWACQQVKRASKQSESVILSILFALSIVLFYQRSIGSFSMSIFGMLCCFSNIPKMAASRKLHHLPLPRLPLNEVSLSFSSFWFIGFRWVALVPAAVTPHMEGRPFLDSLHDWFFYFYSAPFPAVPTIYGRRNLHHTILVNQLFWNSFSSHLHRLASKQNIHGVCVCVCPTRGCSM